jgi:hypothetical protein
MPVIAVAAVYFSVSAGVAIGIGTLAGGLMVAGGVMTGLGALTGNKTLTTLGALTSLGGGIANLANSAALGAEAAGAAGADAAGVAGSADAAGAATSYDITTAATPATGFGDMAPSNYAVGSATNAPGVSEGLTQGTGGLGLQASANSPLTQVPSGGLIGDAVNSVGVSGPAVGMDSGVGLAKVGLGQDSATGGIIGFMQNPKNNNLIQAGLGAVGGLSKSYGDQDMLDQQIAYRQQATDDQVARDEAARLRYNQSITGQRGGLINTNRA